MDIAITLGTEEAQILEYLKFEAAPLPNFRYRKPVYTRRIVAGYSLDFQRAFSRYFFHGSRLYAKTKYASSLNQDIRAARDVGGRKAHQIAKFMQQHFNEVVEDPKGDIGWLKGGMFLWAMGYVPMAALQNLTQTPMMTYPFLASGFGDRKAIAALAHAIRSQDSFYKTGTYEAMRRGGSPSFIEKAMLYGIQSQRLSESQASELAAVSQGGALKGSVGNKVERYWTIFMEKAAWMFEMAEKANRRLAWRAALDLAIANPNAKVVNQAVAKYSLEYGELLTKGYSIDEARAIVTAIHSLEQTQHVYAHYARPWLFRGKLLGTVFIFQKFLQSTLFSMVHNGGGFLLRYMLVAAALGGVLGLPGAEDIEDIVNFMLKKFLGKDFNVERAMREYILHLTDGTVPPDVVLHGLARKGFGVPGLLDLIGSLPKGEFGRGLTAQPATTIPFPIFDMSRSVSLGKVLPLNPARLADGSGRDPNAALVDELQKASGAIFGLGFNMYKFLSDSEKPFSDPKRWERAIPRALGNASRSFRTYSEGRERGYGGPNSAPTIQTFDARDTEALGATIEQKLEVAGMAAGFKPLSVSSQQDMIWAGVEANRYWNTRREMLMSTFNEAFVGGNEGEIEQVKANIALFNSTLPENVEAKAIRAEQLRESIRARGRSRVLKEQGLSTKKMDAPLSRSIQELFPEAIETRRVPR